MVKVCRQGNPHHHFVPQVTAKKALGTASQDGIVEVSQELRVWCLQKCWGFEILNGNELVSLHGLLKKLMWLKLCSCRCVGRKMGLVSGCPGWVCPWSQQQDIRSNHLVAVTHPAFLTHGSNDWFTNLPPQNSQWSLLTMKLSVDPFNEPDRAGTSDVTRGNFSTTTPCSGNSAGKFYCLRPAQSLGRRWIEMNSRIHYADICKVSQEATPM